MAATRGHQIQDRCQSAAMQHHTLCRPDRGAGAKTRGLAASLASTTPVS